MAFAQGSEDFVDKKGKSKSVVWKWYGFAVSDEKQTTPHCKVCLKAVSSKDSSTTNLFQHLEKNPTPEWEQCVALRAQEKEPAKTPPATKQLTLAASFAHGVPYSKTDAKWKRITDAVAFHIAKDMVPIYTVGKAGFKHMLNVIDSRYQLPSRKHFGDIVLPRLYDTTHAKVTKQLEDVQFFSATTDLWSSRTMQPYLSLTVHFITDEWNDHTGEEIAQGLRDALESWHLNEDRLVCMTTDSGTNMIKALRLKKWLNLQCFGHKLHNAIDNGVKDPRIDRAIGLCKKVLITESPTRWRSRQAMIERVLEQEKAIAHVLGSDKKCRHLMLTWQDLEVLESVNKAVKPLQDFTDALFGETYVTVSFIKPTLSMFRSSLLKPEDDDTDLTKTVKENILSYMTDKYSDPEKDELLDMASLMDPRFRTTYIRPEMVEHIKKRAVTELLYLPTDKTTPEPGPAVQVHQEEEAQPGPAPKKRSLASFFQKKNVPFSSLSEEDKIKTELETYLLTPEIREDADPLQWWKKHQSSFPRLSKLAKKYLSIPATSAPSERLFSVGGDIVTCHRASLKPDVVDRLVFLAKTCNCKQRSVKDSRTEGAIGVCKKVVGAFSVTELESLLTEQSISTAGAAGSTLQAEAAKTAEKTLGSFFKKATTPSLSLPIKEVIEMELKSYLLTPEADSETDPLGW
ncbi:E3 SUMO-protein ligase ZBED1-like [Diretmus argenteus]